MNRKIKETCEYCDYYREHVTIIANQKNKLKNICIKFYIQIENI